MATRWLCSSAAGLALAACVTHTSTYYKPTEGESRLDQDEFRQASDQLLGVECPRLLAGADGKAATGEARIRLQYDQSGAVQQAEIINTSGDKQVDTMWGALAARLKFDPQEGQTEPMRPGIIRVGYSCAPNVAVTTVQLP